MNSDKRDRGIFSALGGGIISFFIVGFLRNFYQHFWQFVLLTIILNIACAYLFELVKRHSAASWKGQWRERIVCALMLGLGFVFLLLTIQLLSQYPKLFLRKFFLQGPNLIWIFLGLTVASRIGAVFLFHKQNENRWHTSRFANWLYQNLPGLTLAAIITIATFALATTFSHPEFIYSDNYFDTDSGDWMNRLTADLDHLTVMRPVHPLAFLIFRPPVSFLSILLNGNKFYAALFFNSLLGGACVFLTWVFFKRKTKSSTYALLIAGLLGLSNSHLILSVFLESYLFSALALIVFLLLLQKDEKPLAQLVPVGLLSFGITMTNFVQTCILLFLTTFQAKNLLKYALIVLILALPLAFVQDVLYPSSDPFYIPSSFSQEENYRFNLFEAKPWSVSGRANVLARSLFMYDIVAPQPLILLEETGCHFPCTMVYYYDKNGVYFISSYEGFGKALVFVWLILLSIAGGIFAKKLFYTPKHVALSAALLLNILFNFALHMNYGDDFMLYSPDWTYALVFFFGISLEDHSNNKLTQSILLIFIAGLIVNNLHLFQEILNAVAPFYK